MVSIARKNLFEDLPRFMVAQAGIMFAVGLVTIQAGLYQGFSKSSSLLVDNGKADLWLASKDLSYFDLTLPIDYELLDQSRKVAGVERAEALITRGALWQPLRPAGTPANQPNKLTSVRLIGVDPKGELFTPWKIIQGRAQDLEQPYSVMVDQSDLVSLSGNPQTPLGVGDRAELNNSYTVTVKGITQGIRSIFSGPFAFTSLENANLYTTPKSAFPQGVAPSTPPALRPQDQISFILIRAKPGMDVQDLQRSLQAELPELRAFTQAELSQLTQNYWQRSTGVGFILGMGATVGMVVGMVVVSQILYSSVSDHLKEFATLKAMGASDWSIYRIIIEQALWMAILGYLPGMGICIVLGSWTLQARAIQILITPASASLVLGVTTVMCVGAALIAIRKVTHLDPAMVFKS
uniref:ABC3 transporter permease protein domain-containing protein n=1 Tax=Cyanothece sp. (strain PCC 7425 / ATCC 29141) TaxID=395961 RepID=B8HQ51_CYAP4